MASQFTLVAPPKLISLLHILVRDINFFWLFNGEGVQAIIIFQEQLPPKMRIKSKHLNSLHVCMYAYLYTHILVHIYLIYLSIYIFCVYCVFFQKMAIKSA